MKLLIDISDEEYKTLSKMSEKEKVNELSYYEKIIANGTPYEPEGNLISREAIKKTVVEMLAKWADGYCYIEIPTDDAIKEMESAIDNAPTVKITDYDTGYQDGVEDGLNDIRPQGKWIYNKEMSITCSLWNCSVCNRLNGNDYFNFCPNCGADMRGRQNETGN